MFDPANQSVQGTRRSLLRAGGIAAAFWTVPGLMAEELTRTAALTEGPFYPDRMPLDTDNDLLLLNDATTPALGTITHLSGRILTATGQPVRNAFVEIWQVDNNAVYLHTGSDNGENRDSNFQGYGRCLTDSTGTYYFRTIRPVPYPGRTPHIHLAVSRNGKRVLTTQLLIRGHEQNAKDGVFRTLPDPKDRDTVLGDFRALPDSPINEQAVEWDIVLGVTAAEDENGTLRGGISAPQWGRRRR